MKSVAIEVLPASGPEPQRRIFGVPATIGRASDADVRLDPANKAISRIHVEVVEEDGAILVVNRASNEGATLAAGRPLPPAARVPLPARGSVQLRIFEATVVISPAGALRIRVRRAGETLAEAPLSDGEILRAVVTGETVGLAPVAAEAVRDALGDGPAFAFFLDRGQPAAMVLNQPEGCDVLLDGGLVRQESLYLRPLEALSAAGLRFELLEDGHEAIACPAEGCGALNPAGATACRVCGSTLAPTSDATRDPAVS